MDWNGFAGNVLYVDLSAGELESRPLSRDLCEQYLGGLGGCIRLAYENIVPGTEPLAPENPIIVGAGTLVGTSVPASSRVYGMTRLPQSRSVGWCGGGGVNFGAFMKYAGFDFLVITGKADRPVYLDITGDAPVIRDAGPLWGLEVEATCDALWEKHGRPAGVLGIGQAGENQAAYAMAFVDRLSTMGRGGFGAVMGSKNLKAVVARGMNGITVADRKAYKKLTKDLFENIRNYPYLKEWQDLGLMKSLPIIPREEYSEAKVRRMACVSCPIGDKDIIRVSGLTATSSSAMNLYVPTIFGMKDHTEAVTLMTMLDGYGMDMFEFFAAVGYAGDLAAAGIISSDEATPPIDLTKFESMKIWAEKTAFRQGLGDLIAQGLDAILERYGPEAEPYLPYKVKGMMPYAGPKAPLPWNLFGTMELGQILDPRGPHVGSGGSPTYFAQRPLEVFPKHLKRMGVPDDALDRILPGWRDGAPTDLNIGRLLKYSHRWFTILGSLGVCARAQINRFYNYDLCSDLYQAVTGIPTQGSDLGDRANAAWALLKTINMREGFGRKDEEPPAKWFEEPPFCNYLTGKPITPEEVGVMTGEYYDEQGWDSETGAPPMPAD
ncbi:Aldehyde ferredoxin oxidoreductase [Desulfatibacillum aliphaticivorans]|uniref:Aldehyde ferredoxin oxidoreductase n=1 Tax=Desulfatibacillum aliphaticivorans TaxID=218208 RepID=B8FKT8_DESAL|nr:aldehyde ferredoxin oxidoreductase N-terminal domain-containing protein [Desulfatibacillum aliphaticivorans]ACL04460.1 Aldehyde ferredoxin oxidoreductase [Desulfatibacillum aliphaticivorans]